MLRLGGARHASSGNKAFTTTLGGLSGKWGRREAGLERAAKPRKPITVVAAAVLVLVVLVTASVPLVLRGGRRARGLLPSGGVKDRSTSSWCCCRSRVLCYAAVRCRRRLAGSRARNHYSSRLCAHACLLYSLCAARVHVLHSASSWAPKVGAWMSVLRRPGLPHFPTSIDPIQNYSKMLSSHILPP